MTPGWIRSQLKLRTLIRVHAGVYAVGHVPRVALARSMAAVLACGDGAVLSHASAAALWGVGDWPHAPEVTVGRPRRRPGIRGHVSRTLTHHEIRSHQGIRVTSPARTVLDLQPRLTDARLVRIVNDLRVAGHLRASAFTQLCADSRRIDTLLGAGGARAGDSDGGPGSQRPTRSALEDLLRPFTRRHDLPMPLLNAILPGCGREVDALYPDAKLILELDSWRHHSDRASFERDRAKDARALADGYRTLRITERRLRTGGADEAAIIRRLLGDDI